MKKPLPGDGMALSKLLYGDHSKLDSQPENCNCSASCRSTGPGIAARDGRNLGELHRSEANPSHTSKKVIEAVKSQFCQLCRLRFNEAYKKAREG